MKYMGSKNRIANEILPIILKNRRPQQWYVEPFVGGANTIDKVIGPRIGADVNEYLISLLTALSQGWTPPQEMSEALYNDIKNHKDNYSKELVGFAGFPCSYAAKWFGGYCRGKTNKGKPRDYIMEAWRNVEKQKSSLRDIEFVTSSYDALKIPRHSVIYCDPPYASATSYRDSFDHESFWEWCRDMASDGHQVFISEYNAPDDFICLWSKEIISSLTRDTGAKRGIECLYTFTDI